LALSHIVVKNPTFLAYLSPQMFANMHRLRRGVTDNGCW
jgi:hypothetical protein